MDFATFLKAIKKSWWLIVGMMLLGAAAGVVRVSVSDPLYASTVLFFVSTPTETTGAPLQADLFAQRRINSYLHLLGTEGFAERVIAASGVDSTVGEVESAISGSSESNTVLLTVRVVASTPERALALATGVKLKVPVAFGLV